MAADRDPQFSALTGARQTMSAWAKVIESPEDLPEAYRSAYTAVAGAAPPWPHTVLAPSIAGLRRRTTEKLLCELSDTLYVWERTGDRVSLAAYPLATVSDLEIGSILLYSWITIGGVTQAGAPSATTIEYNTTARRHFAPFVGKLRPAPAGTDARARDAERAKFDFLAAEAYKFMNYARESLVDGEKVVRTVWQPRIDKPVIRLLGRTLYRTTLSPARLAILTDKEFIVIQDDPRTRESRGIRYGGVWRYAALGHIGAVALHERAGGLLTLALTLTPGGRRWEAVFAAGRRQEVARLVDELEQLAGHTASARLRKITGSHAYPVT